MRATDNRLLCALTPDLRDDFTSEFEAVSLIPGQVLQDSCAPIRHAYFPNDGVISVLASSSLGEGEIGMIGREGMTSIPLILESDRAPNRIVVQIAGDGLRVEAETLLRWAETHRELRSVLLRYSQCWTTQVAQTALANARNTVRERLARWLVMCRDRVDSDEVPITHEALAAIMGVRRPGVTVATHELEGEGALRARRGCLRILDRAKLGRAANGSYGVSEREYERLIGERSGPQPPCASGHAAPMRGAA